jgi:hypothetical protein
MQAMISRPQEGTSRNGGQPQVVEKDGERGRNRTYQAH